MMSGDASNPIVDFVPLRYRGADVKGDLSRGLQAKIASCDAANLGIVFGGDVGRGKTHAMAAMANRTIDKAALAARGWIDWAEFCRDVHASWGLKDLNERRRFDPIAWAIRVPMLYVDDLGQEKDDRSTEFFTAVVGGRYDNRRTLCVTTNLTADELERYGGKTASRLREMCAFVNLTGADRRLRTA